MSRRKKASIFFGALPLFLCASVISLAPTGCTTGSQHVSNLREGEVSDPAVETLPLAVPAGRNTSGQLGEPLTMFVEPDFIGAGHCALCHSLLTDQEGRDMSITGHWRSTLMANASKDPIWQAKVVSETSRHPAIRQVIEKKCVTCHMPMAMSQMQADPASYPGEKDDLYDTLVNPQGDLHEAAMDGVSCSLCHQIEDKGLGGEKTFSGTFSINTEIPAPDRPLYGPYRETIGEPMRTSIGFDPVYGPHTNDSALCATCHTLYTPYVDSDGNIAGTFPEQTPYLEWLHSEYAETPGSRHTIEESIGTVRICQECHMPHSKAGGVMIARPAPPEAVKQDHFSQHHFVGGNILMLNILDEHSEELKVSASSRRMDDTRKRAASLLQDETATLDLGQINRDGDHLRVTVTVRSKTGHKFPTGFPSRRAWLHLVFTGADGNTIFESGRPLADGTVAGDDRDARRGYEPHHDLINGEGQVQIYESVMKNTDGETTHTLLRAAGYIKDNRLLPRGFDKKTASADIAVRGAAMADSNFTGGSDQVTYMVPVGDAGGPFTITARLLYTTVSRNFMDDLGKDIHLPEVQRMVGYYDETDKTPVTVAAVRATLD